MTTDLIHITPNSEKLIAYSARVSSANPNNPNISGLLKYCIKHKHWSVFEMATMCVEIVTSRAIAQQILRHRSFTFQEYSQRYSEVTQFETYEARSQDNKNRQNSIDDMNGVDKEWFIQAQFTIQQITKDFYKEALSRKIAKEQARFLLPLSTQTKLYMHGNIRNWIHYIELRSSNGTQKEHADIANAIKLIFIKELPIIANALEWDKGDVNV